MCNYKKIYLFIFWVNEKFTTMISMGNLMPPTPGTVLNLKALPYNKLHIKCELKILHKQNYNSLLPDKKFKIQNSH